MRTLAILALILAACGSKPSASKNRAIAFLTFAEPSADCLALDTDRKGMPDTASCRIKGKLVCAIAGEGTWPAWGPCPSDESAAPPGNRPATGPSSPPAPPGTPPGPMGPGPMGPGPHP